MKYKIYTLSHPITDEIRYIGRTTDTLNSRLSKHIHERKKYKNHRCHWINKLYEEGLKPKIELLDETEDEKQYFELETYWIYQFESWGFSLVNETYGGEGSLGYKHGPEAIMKIREANEKRYKNHVYKIVKRMSMEEKYNLIRRALSIKVNQYDVNGKYLKTWDSATEAAKFYNKRASIITNATNCNSYTKRAIGFLWKKYDGEITNIIPKIKKMGPKNESSSN